MPSLTTSAPSSPRSRRREACCRLAEISALFHSAGSAHLRGRGEIALHLDLGDLRRRAPYVLAPPRARDPLGDPHLPPPGVRPRDALPAARRAATTQALATLAEAGVLDARHAPLERPPKRVVGRACCRGAYLRGALLGGGSLSGPRSPHLELRTPRSKAPSSSAPSPRPRGPASASSTAAATPSRTPRAWTRSSRCSPPPAPATRCSRFEERSIVAAARAEANRLANSDHANLVRTSRAAQWQLEAVRALTARHARAAAGPSV